MVEKSKIEIVNLKKEISDLKDKLVKSEESYKEMFAIVCKVFSDSFKEKDKEIKSLKLGWANKEADLILKQIREKIK